MHFNYIWSTNTKRRYWGNNPKVFFQRGRKVFEFLSDSSAKEYLWISLDLCCPVFLNVFPVIRALFNIRLYSSSLMHLRSPQFQVLLLHLQSRWRKEFFKNVVLRTQTLIDYSERVSRKDRILLCPFGMALHLSCVPFPVTPWQNGSK